MKSFLITISVCLSSVCVFAQYSTSTHTKPGIPQDTVVARYQPPAYSSTPAHLDFTITKATVTPFFCRQEIKWEQALKFPLRVRLGSVDQANWLEQKGDRYQPFK